MIYVVIFVIAMLLSAFFSSSEIAYTSINVLRLEKLADEGKKAAKLALRIRNSYESMLSSLLIANDLVNIAMSSVATVLSIHYAATHPISESAAGTISTILITILVLIFGEITPKVLAKQHALGYAMIVAYPLYFVTILFYPISKPVSLLIDAIRRKSGQKEEPTVTEDELSTIIETAEEEGVVDEDQSELLQSALDYQETTVENIMTPRIYVDGIDQEKTKEEILKICLSNTYSRLPVYEDSLDHIVGILPVTTFLKAAAEEKEIPDITDYLLKPLFLHKTSKLPSVLSMMRSKKMHLAIVMDEYGGTMGIVTMEDILEEIVGDIYDESDVIEPQDIVPSDENTYEVDGMTPIADFFDELEIDDRDFDSEYTTMGGWAVEMLEEDPHVGDSFEWKNLLVIVTEMKDNLVSKMSIRINQELEE